MTDSAELRFGPFRLLSRHGPLLRGKDEIKLWPKSLTLLWTMARQAGEVVPRRALLDAVWPGLVVGDDALTFQIQTLRRALEDDIKHPQYLVTVHRIGFKFDATVEYGAQAVDSSDAATQFVGRQAELQSLQAHFQLAKKQQRQVVFITGEAGIGKSQLLEQFLAQLAQQQPQVQISRGHCTEQSGTSEAYLPVLEALGRLLRDAADDRTIALARRAAPSWLLQLPTLLDPADYASLKQQTSGVRPDRMLREMAEFLDLLSADQPLVLVLEDLHWSDTPTLDLLTTLAQRRDPARLLIVCTCRPVDAIITQHPVRAAQKKLLATARASELILNYLLPAEVNQYLSQALGAARTTPELSARVLQRSSGHPLFLKQISDYLMQTSDDAADLDTHLPQALRELIELQLARLTLGEQLVLEVASVIGAEFSAASVAAGSGLTVDTVELHCEQLIQQGQFIEDRGLAIWPDGTTGGRFRFRHALYLQVLHKRLESSRSARLNRQIALRMEAAFGPRAAEVASELARHFEDGGLPAKTAQYCVFTARTALERVALEDVGVQATRGLSFLDAVPELETRNEIEMALRITAVAALQALHGYGTSETAPHFERMRVLLEQVQNPLLLEAALNALWVAAHAGAQFETALGYAEQLKQLAHDLGKPELECSGYSWASNNLHLLARHVEADQHSEHAIRIARAIANDPNTILLIEPGCVAMTSHALTRWYLGFPDQALQYAKDACVGSERIGNPYTHCFLHCGGINNVLMMRRQWQALLAACEKSISLSEKYGHHDMLSWSHRQQAIAQASLGDASTHLQRLSHILEREYARNAFVSLPLDYTHLTEGYLALGELALARAAIGTAREIMQQRKMRAWEPEILRVEAELLMAENPKQQAAAQTLLEEALHIARTREVLSLELRSAMSLARIQAMQRAGRKTALKTLEAVHSRYTEGFDTHDLLAAQAQLLQLREKRA